jgi:hypothetical protein
MGNINKIKFKKGSKKPDYLDYGPYLYEFKNDKWTCFRVEKDDYSKSILNNIIKKGFNEPKKSEEKVIWCNKSDQNIINKRLQINKIYIDGCGMLIYSKDNIFVHLYNKHKYKLFMKLVNSIEKFIKLNICLIIYKPTSLVVYVDEEKNKVKRRLLLLNKIKFMNKY